MSHFVSTHTVLIIHLLICVIDQSASFKFLQKSIVADIYPKDALVFVGESLLLTCVLKDSVHVNVTEVYFNFVSHNNTFQWRLPSEDHVISDDRTVSAKVKVTDRFTHRTTAECKTVNGTFLTSCNIYVERPIKNITNFSAYYLYKDHVNITWSVDQNYMRQPDIGVDIGWSNMSLQNKSSTELMPCNESSMTHCVITEPDRRYLYVLAYLYLRITVYHKQPEKRPQLENFTPLLATNATAEFQIDMNDVTKSHPPVNLKCVHRNSTCVNVSWTNPDYLKFTDTLAYGTITSFYYNLRYSPEDSRYPTAMSNDTYTIRSLPLTICNLRPYTNYTTSVQLRLYKMQPWSEWSNIKLQTDEDRPLTGPPMVGTSFYSSGCSKSQRDVYIYWQRPDPVSLQGVLTGFEIGVTSPAHVSTSTAPPASNYFKLESLSCDEGYNISVFTTTKVGRSYTPSVVSVSRFKRDYFSDIDLKIEETQNLSSSSTSRILNITWRHNTQEEATLVFYRCHESNTEYTCSDELVITEVRVSQRFMFLENVSVNHDLFGYALKLTSGQTNGIHWEKCVYHRDAKPSRLSNLMVTSGASQGSLDIFWFIERCRVTKPLVQYFTIFVCNAGERITTKMCRQYNVSDGTQSFTVDSLQVGDEYNVSIRAWTPRQTGERIGYVTGKILPKRIDMVSPRVILATSFIIIAAVFLSVIVIYCYTRCRKSRGKFSKLKYLLNEDTLCTTKVSFDHQDSEESGIVTDISSMLDNDRNDWVNEQRFTKTPPMNWSSATRPLPTGQLVTDLYQSPPLDYLRLAKNTGLGAESHLSIKNTPSLYHWLHTGGLYQNRLTFLGNIKNDSHVMQCQFSKNSNQQCSSFKHRDISETKFHECRRSENDFSDSNTANKLSGSKTVKGLNLNEMGDYITTHYLDYVEVQWPTCDVEASNVAPEPGSDQVSDGLDGREVKFHRDVGDDSGCSSDRSRHPSAVAGDVSSRQLPMHYHWPSEGYWFSDGPRVLSLDGQISPEEESAEMSGVNSLEAGIEYGYIDMTSRYTNRLETSAMNDFHDDYTDNFDSDGIRQCFVIVNDCGSAPSINNGYAGVPLQTTLGGSHSADKLTSSYERNDLLSRNIMLISQHKDGSCSDLNGATDDYVA